MSYLLDTCVLSECVKKNPSISVGEWLDQQSPEQLYVSSITIAEIKKGLYNIRDTQPERFQKLEFWLNTIVEIFNPRILPITTEVLENWAIISANAELQGRKLAVMDSLIAATADYYRLTLVTRNVDDFKSAPVNIINPFN